MTHYDDPPPDSLGDLDRVVGPDGARFANELRAWIEVKDGRIVGHGQSGSGRISTSKVKLGGFAVLVPAKAFPELRPEPEIGDGFVRFRQTAGGRPGLPSPRLVRERPFVKISGPTVWTTLLLTLHANGRSERSLVGATAFPRHWLYDDAGALVGKSAVIDFKDWYQHSFGTHSPWGNEDNAVPTADAETALERRLSTIIMRHGETRRSRPRSRRAGRSSSKASGATTSRSCSTAWSTSRSAASSSRSSAPARCSASAPVRDRERAPRPSPPRPTAASCTSAVRCSTTTTCSSSSPATAAKTALSFEPASVRVAIRGVVTPVR